MMNTIAIIVSIIVGVMSWISERNLYNPGTIMGFLWALICSLASMRLYFLYEASEFTYILITLAIASFGIGCFVSKYCKIKVTRGGLPRIFNKSDNSDFCYSLIRFLCIISVFMLADNAISNAKAILSGMDMSEIRARETVSSYGHVILYLINNYIVRPFSFALLPVFAVNFFMSERKDKLITVCTILIIIERVLIEGGRFIIMYVLCALLVTLAVTKKKLKISKMQIFLFICIAVISYIGVYYITLSRGTEDVGKSLYFYLCGCVPHLSIRLGNLQNSDMMTYGFASINGYVHYVFTILENFGIPYPSFLAETKEAIQIVEQQVMIAPGSTFNAFVSPVFYMFLDGRTVGVAIGMFLYGFFSYNVYKKLKNKINPRNLAVYLMIVQGLATTMVRIQFSNVYYSISFVFIFLLINKIVPDRKHGCEDALDNNSAKTEDNI